MRPLDLDYNVIELKASGLGDAKTTATGETDDDTVASVVRRSAGAGLQIGQDSCKFTTTQKTPWVEVPRCDDRHNDLRLKWDSWSVIMSTGGWPEGNKKGGRKLARFGLLDYARKPKFRARRGPTRRSSFERR
jgi:hypothetical protein